MPHCVYAGMKTVQAGGLQSASDHLAAESRLEQLSSSHYPVLTVRERRDHPIGFANLCYCIASLSFRRLVEHALSLADRDARVARRMGRIGGENVAAA